MIKNFSSSFEHFLDEWSTEQHPSVLVNYTFIDGDKTVGEADQWEICVIRDKKDIWMQLSEAEQTEITTYCQLDMKQTIKEFNDE